MRTSIFLLWVLPAVASCNTSGTKNQLRVQDSGATVIASVPQNNCRLIHVFTALCDNDYQGIVKVGRIIGNGDDPNNNLYWGCGYGNRTYFNKSAFWKLIQKSGHTPDSIRMERLVYKHRDSNVYLVIDGYRGRNMERCLVDYTLSLEQKLTDSITLAPAQKLYLYASAQLVVFTGHNGLMDMNIPFSETPKHPQQAMAICCLSNSYFYERLILQGVQPILLTSSLMCPEAYSLHDALQSWIKRESNEKIRMAAVNAYARYQKIPVSSAQNIFSKSTE